MHGTRFLPQGIRLGAIAGILFIAGTCELGRAQARPDSPPATIKPPGTGQNPHAESELETGTELTRGGHFAEAIAHLLEAQGRVSNEYAAEFNLALCYTATGQFERAIPLLSRLREKGRENVSVENLLAQAKAGDGQAGEPYDALQKAGSLKHSHDKL